MEHSPPIHPPQINLSLQRPKKSAIKSYWLNCLKISPKRLVRKRFNVLSKKFALSGEAKSLRSAAERKTRNSLRCIEERCVEEELEVIRYSCFSVVESN